MKRFITEGENGPIWAAPISQAAGVGNTCYLSGQLAIDHDGNDVPGTGHEEARHAFQNVARRPGSHGDRGTSLLRL